ncbi:ABC transporter substrate-binding protein [Oceanospirillaceae bacterium G-43]|uniref:ABC transporter substrate-binding protein n=2 Tax=Parathalassolituus penaei TaxID=2997323 RepID=A0A9X3IRB2_9GAMM|nr:ABC transporter substrate-binding protein [Parathalassolituus penaei]
MNRLSDHSEMLFNSPFRLSFSLLLVMLLAGCQEQAWNNPHPDEDGDARILYSSFSSRPKHLDPARSYSSDESRFIDQIYEPPLEYHYLKRPYELIPNTLTEMPQIEYSDAHGNPVPEQSPLVAYSTYVLTIKPGIHYQPHPAFALGSDGNPRYRFASARDSQEYQSLEDFTETGTRELVSDDYIYQIKRLADPANLSPVRGLLAEFIVGMDEFGDRVTAIRKERPRNQRWVNLDDLDMEGLERLNDYQFSIRLKGKYPQFRYWLAYHFFAPVPELVDEFYNQPGLADRNIVLDWHPVGTGAFMMTRNDPNEVIVLERNPNFREDLYPSEGEKEDEANGLLAAAGQPMPFLDKVVYRLEKEAIPLWSKFLQGYYDRSGIGADSFDQAVSVGSQGIRLSDEMIEKGITMEIEVVPGTYYLAFNMLDPIVGGQRPHNAPRLNARDAKEHQKTAERARKLRQAISIAFDQEESISIFANGRGEVGMGPIPPGIFGYQTGRNGLNNLVYDWVDDGNGGGRAVLKPIEYARKLMAEAGYPDGRDADTGKPLVLNYETTSGGGNSNQIWLIKQFRKLGIELNIRSTDYNRFQEKIRTGNAQIFSWGWMADYPDAENFLFLLYGPNGQVATDGAGVNSSNYSNPEYDRLFDRMKLMPDSPERMAVIRKMLDIFQHDAPWGSVWHPHAYVLNNPWVKNTKAHGISQSVLKYIDIDPEMRDRVWAERNPPVITPLLTVLGLLFLLGLGGYLAWRKRLQVKVFHD